ncbi:hypothetical protein WICPIJ_003465 [Wickerhamomyces pijperi]|uniref:Uncharacterized protein n=1 Tax=Wickerhamomyces pijperi TaxID=599730 RepID=A0A9P8TNU8_WICPI|nr:hypothetical protein WICPIJ_003465 [Wickerhamomyces pijperi]
MIAPVLEFGPDLGPFSEAKPGLTLLLLLLLLPVAAVFGELNCKGEVEPLGNELEFLRLHGNSKEKGCVALSGVVFSTEELPPLATDIEVVDEEEMEPVLPLLGWSTGRFKVKPNSLKSLTPLCLANSFISICTCILKNSDSVFIDFFSSSKSVTLSSNSFILRSLRSRKARWAALFWAVRLFFGSVSIGLRPGLVFALEAEVLF